MNELLAWYGLKRFPFDKNIAPRDVLDTPPLKECSARLDYIKRRGGILLLTGEPGVGKTVALRRFVDSLNENLFKTFYTPLSTLSPTDLLYHLQEGMTPADDRLPKFLHQPLTDTGKVITEAEMETMLAEYYRLHGWNENGMP